MTGAGKTPSCRPARRRFIRLLASGGLMCLFWPGEGRAQQPLEFETSRLRIRTSSGEHPFTVEMAVTEDQRTRGLMYRRSLAPDKGMLFDYGRETYISMWMRNTYVSLDMLFIGADGRINYIRERTTPLSLANVEAPGRNRAVLEVPAGTVARLGIRKGDVVEHDIFH